MKLKKVLSYALAAAMVFSSVNGYDSLQQKVIAAEQNVNVATQQLEGVTANVDIKESGNEDIINAFTTGTRTIGGKLCNNYANYSGVQVEGSSFENDGMSADKAIDKNLDSRWGSAHSEEPQYLLIDLGNTYSLNYITLYWEAASAKKYEVQVSEDGENFQTITTVESNKGKRTDDISFSKTINVQKVRIYCMERTTQYGYSLYEVGLYGYAPQLLSNLKVTDYYKYTGKYMIYFSGQDGATSYNAYIDDSETPVKKNIKSGDYLSVKELAGIANGKHTLSVASFDVNGNELSRVSKDFSISDSVGTYTEIPQVYIYSSTAINRDYHSSNDVSVTIVDKDGGKNKDLVDSECNIKIRGNSTAGASKKPWNIKLSGKQKVLGMDKGKKWCLLANAFDKSLMRNSLVYDFGLEHGVTYTSKSRFVDVYVNGRYNGNYLMTEPVEAKTGRVEIDAYNGESNDILLELGTRNEQGVDHFTTSILGTTFDVNDPEKGDDLADDAVDAKIARVKTYLEQFETALRNGTYEDALAYMDEDTFVNFYIVNELFKNVDFNFSSTRFYIKDNKIYAGPLWDYDLSSGNCKSSFYIDYYVDGVSYKGYYCRNMNWYRELFKKDEFQKKVSERYKALQYAVQNIYKEDSETTISIDYLLNSFGASFERNYIGRDNLGAGWSLGSEAGDGYSLAGEAGWTTWMQPIDFLRDWLKNRNIWLCEQWGIDMESAYEESKPGVNPTTVAPTTTEPITEYVTTTKPAIAESTVAVTDGTSDVSDKISVGKTRVIKASKSRTKKVKISLKKVKGATGYVVTVSTSKKFKGNGTITKTLKKTNIVFKKLKNKKYYVRARAFKRVNGKKYYGNWSSVKRISLKK